MSMLQCTHIAHHAVSLDERNAANKGQEHEWEVDETVGGTGQHFDSVAIGGDGPED